MFDRVLQRVQELSPGRMVALAILASEALTLVIVAAMGLLLHGAVTFDFIITGIVAALIVSFLVVAIIIFVLNRLRENEARYRKLFESEASAVLIFDADTMRIEDANPATLKLFGYSREEFLKLTPKDISGEIKETEKAADAAIRGDLRHIPVLYQKKKDGTLFPAEIFSGTFSHMNRKKVLGVVIDLSEKMKAEEIIKESREKYMQIFQHAIDYILVLKYNPPHVPVILEMSDSAIERHGYTRDELIGKPITFLDSQASEGVFSERMRLLASNKEARFEAEHLTRDGKKLIVEVNAKMITINGKPLIYTIERDITERKKLEQYQLELIRQTVDALEESKEERKKAEEANRLKSEFIANMSHELNTPLTSVLGYSRLANDRDRETAETMGKIIEIVDGLMESPPQWAGEIRNLAKSAQKVVSETASYDTIIIEQGQRLFNLLNDLMDLSMLESGQMKVECHMVSAFMLLASVIRDQEAAATAKGLALATNINDFRPSDLIFMGDHKKLEKVINNLVQNSIKYSQKGTISITIAITGPKIEFRVRDQGIGIKSHEKEKIFETFLQLDGSSTRQQGGLGLGLSLSRKLVTAMGGEINVESEIGNGSEFVIVLPYTVISEIATT